MDSSQENDDSIIAIFMEDNNTQEEVSFSKNELNGEAVLYEDDNLYTGRKFLSWETCETFVNG